MYIKIYIYIYIYIPKVRGWLIRALRTKRNRFISTRLQPLKLTAVRPWWWARQDVRWLYAMQQYTRLRGVCKIDITTKTHRLYEPREHSLTSHTYRTRSWFTASKHTYRHKSVWLPQGQAYLYHSFLLSCYFSHIGFIDFKSIYALYLWRKIDLFSYGSAYKFRSGRRHIDRDLTFDRHRDHFIGL